MMALRLTQVFRGGGGVKSVGLRLRATRRNKAANGQLVFNHRGANL
jgi:hypothetical protein